MIDGLDRLLLGPSREMMDQVAMGLAAATVVLVLVLLGVVALSIGRGTGRGGSRDA